MSSEMNTFQYDGREKKAVRIEIPIYYIAVARKDWELPNSRRRGRESVLTPVPQRLFPLIIFPGERDIG